MKIVHCLFTFKTGGAQVLSVDLLNEMCVQHEVSLIIVNNQWNDKLLKQLDKRVAVFYIGRKEGSKNPIPIIRLNLLLLKLKPDIIHCHEPKMACIIKTKNSKLLQTIHDVGIPTDYYDLYNVSVAISDAVYADVIPKYNAHRVKKVYNGISFELFRQRNQFKIKNGEPLRLVQLSRLVYEKKGQDVLLNALHKILNDYNIADFTLDFIGGGESQAFLEKMVLDLGLQKNVNFIGERSRDWLFENLSSYHLLVQPSRYEGFGLTILEGFAAGLPVLASNIDGPAEIISHAPGGFLFENGDIENCAKSLVRIFDLYSNNEIEALMNKTILPIRNTYSIKCCTRRYLNVYDLLME